MGYSLIPYVVDVSHLVEVINRPKKDFSLFNSHDFQRVNSLIKAEKIQGATGKLLYEDIITQNFRFSSYKNDFIYTFALESLILAAIGYSEFYRHQRYNKLLEEGVQLSEQKLAYLQQDLPIKDHKHYHFKNCIYNKHWVPCSVDVLDHLDLKLPINIPLSEGYFISTIYNHEFDTFLSKLDLANCTDELGDKQFRYWFQLAQLREEDVVLVFR